LLGLEVNSLILSKKSFSCAGFKYEYEESGFSEERRAREFPYSKWNKD
jgi:hypothetical protein